MSLADPEAERALLGALILHPHLITGPRLVIEDDEPRVLWQHKRGCPVPRSQTETDRLAKRLNEVECMWHRNEGAGE